ncbi:MAG: AsmA family protein, partial [Verrucomicrobiota bacterium]
MSALAGLVAIVVVLLLAINLYVQSPGTQARIQEELSKALKLPLQITNSSFTPWSDLRINGITIPAAQAEHDKFLEAASFSARFRFWPLLRRKLVIYQMRVESPRIAWVQNEEGKWVLPALPKAPANAAAKKGEKSKNAKAKGIEVTLDGFKVHGGSVELLDKLQKRVALLSEIEMNYSVITADRLEGTLIVGRLNYADLLFFENVRSPFTYADGELKLPALQALVAGGTLTGSFTLDSEKKNSPFVTALRFEKVDAARLSTEAGWMPGQAAGVLAGALDLHGSSRQVERAEGTGELS